MPEPTATPTKDYYAPEPLPHEEGTAEVMDLTIVNQAELNQQVVTARRFPRSITSFRRRVYELVTMDEDIAQACIYALPRDGKVIEGPSIRFAEALMTCWGNCRMSSAVTDVGEEFITAEGMFFDLENNMAIKADVMRRITGKAGKRYGADMIGTTGNAACSIAMRNAVLRGIPKAIWQDMYDEAKKVAGGTAQTFIARRDKVMKELAIQGATPNAVFGLLGIVGIDDMKSEHVVQLRALQNAIRDGETSVESAFAPKEGEGKPGEAVPPRPKQSAFDRGTDRETGEKKAEAAKPEAAKAEPEVAKAAGEAVQTQANQQATAPQEAEETASSAATDYEDWYKDRIAELATVGKVRDLGPLRELVRDNIDSDAREKDWDARCDARQKEIMGAVGKKK